MQFSKVEDIASRFGLSVVGLALPVPLEDDRKRLVRWQEEGFAAGMGYMLRDASLLSDPARLFPEAKSILSIGLPYDRSSRPLRQEGFGRVARYAWGMDYHTVAKALIGQFVENLSKECGKSIGYRAFSDSVPLLERAVAARAGIGVVGRNGLLIRKGEGSYLFLAEILWDLEVDGWRGSEPVRACEDCALCRSMCPTGALVRDYTIDARKCVSYLTIEKRGILDETERRLLGEWAFGCDDCQECCPVNRDALRGGRKALLPQFCPEEGPGPLLDLKAVLEIRTEAAFRARYRNTAFLRTRREGILRNAAIVAGNTKSECVLSSLLAAVEEDPSDVIRAHAVAAVIDIQSACGSMRTDVVERIVNRALSDPSPAVRAESRRHSS